MDRVWYNSTFTFKFNKYLKSYGRHWLTIIPRFCHWLMFIVPRCLTYFFRPTIYLHITCIYLLEPIILTWPDFCVRARSGPFFALDKPKMNFQSIFFYMARFWPEIAGFGHKISARIWPDPNFLGAVRPGPWSPLISSYRYPGHVRVRVPKIDRVKGKHALHYLYLHGLYVCIDLQISTSVINKGSK